MANTIDNGRTCLEKRGFEARKEQLLKNKWKKEYIYSKPFVEQEYLIESEFKVCDKTNERIREEVELAKKREEELTAKKQEKKIKKLVKKYKKEQEKQEKRKEDRKKEPKEKLESTVEAIDDNETPKQQYGDNYYTFIPEDLMGYLKGYT